MRGHQQEMWYKIWMLRQWGNWGWVLDGYFWSEETLAGLYWLLGWIFLYRLDCIVSAGSYCIDCILLEKTGFYALSGSWLDGTDGMDGLDGTLVGREWDGLTLAGTVTELHHFRRNWSNIIVSWRVVGRGKWWLAPIESVLQGRRVFVPKNKNNKNRVHTNWN